MLALIILFILLPLAVYLLVRRGQKLTPAETVLNYINATIAGRTSDAYNLLSAKDKANESLPGYQARRSLGHGLLAGMIAGKVRVSVVDATVSGDEASVTVSIAIPDFRAMMHEALTGMAGDEFPDNNLDAFVFVCRSATHYLGKFGGDATPMKGGTETMRLVREEDRWRVVLNI